MIDIDVGLAGQRYAKEGVFMKDTPSSQAGYPSASPPLSSGVPSALRRWDLGVVPRLRAGYSPKRVIKLSSDDNDNWPQEFFMFAVLLVSKI